MIKILTNKHNNIKSKELVEITSPPYEEMIQNKDSLLKRFERMNKGEFKSERLQSLKNTIKEYEKNAKTNK